MDSKKIKDIVKRVVTLAAVVGITALLLHPTIWIFGGFVLVKWLLILLLAGIVARVVFKKSIKDIILGDEDD